MPRQIQEAYIVAAVRTPVARAFKGVFRHTRPDDLLAHVIKQVVAQVPTIEPQRIDDVIIGCAMPEAEQGMNVARIGLLLAGLPDAVPGVTVNRFCASSLQAIAMANDQIGLGHADIIIAGGTESMSLIPMGGHKLAANPAYYKEREKHINIAFGMGVTAELVAQKYKITREAQDAFAYESHQRAIKAQAADEFATEIVPYTVIENLPDLNAGGIRTNTHEINQDEGPRADTSLDALAKLRPVFARQGTITAGNSSQMSDGAAAVVLVSEKILKACQLTPLACLRSYAVVGVAPELMGIAPTLAIPKALQQADKKLADMDWIELNEAFAAQAVAVIQETQLDQAKVNPLGGAIALGHPLGATGAIRTASLVHGLRRCKQKYGMVTMCIGTGMGAAGVFEAV